MFALHTGNPKDDLLNTKDLSPIELKLQEMDNAIQVYIFENAILNY